MINYSDFSKIHEDTGNPRNQILSLSHLLENAQKADIFGDIYIEIADRIYKAWFNICRENTVKKIIYLKNIIITRQKSRSFNLWALAPPRNKTRVLIKPLDPSVKNFSGDFIRLPKESEFRFTNTPDVKQIINYPPGPAISLLQHAASASQFKKECRDEKEALHIRLYENPTANKALFERSQAQERNRGMDECTSQPEIADYTQKRPSVLERPNTSDINEEAEFYKKQKHSYGVQGYTLIQKLILPKPVDL